MTHRQKGRLRLARLENIELDPHRGRVEAAIEKYWRANRVPLSREMSQVIHQIADQWSLDLLEARTGESCLEWTVPPSWEVQEAFLQAPDGRVIADFREHPLRLWTASVPFQGSLDLEELREHILFDRERPDAIPYHFRNGYRPDSSQWGFCLRYREYLALEPGIYRVCIRSELRAEGRLHTATGLVKGRDESTYLLAAHLCHPGMVTDGLSSALACLEVVDWLRRLSREGKLRYSYRVVLGPEYYAAAIFLEKHPCRELSRLRGTIFLDMIGNGRPLEYQRSLQGDSRMDRALGLAMNSLGCARCHDYRGLWGNDETFYNGPGFGIPSPGLGGGAFAQYHSDGDSPALFCWESFARGVQALGLTIQILEEDFVPRGLFRGPVHLSSLGLYIDPLQNPIGYASLEKLQILANGEKSLSQISLDLGVDFFWARDFYRALAAAGRLEILPVDDESH